MNKDPAAPTICTVRSTSRTTQVRSSGATTTIYTVAARRLVSKEVNLSCVVRVDGSNSMRAVTRGLIGIGVSYVTFFVGVRIAYPLGVSLVGTDTTGVRAVSVALVFFIVGALSTRLLPQVLSFGACTTLGYLLALATFKWAIWAADMRSQITTGVASYVVQNLVSLSGGDWASLLIAVVAALAGWYVAGRLPRR
jgi:hypothetical protein